MQVKGLSLPDETDFSKQDNIDSIQKYMDYRLIEVNYSGDIPKDALRIAKMAGIDEEIIKDAENYLK